MWETLSASSVRGGNQQRSWKESFFFLRTGINIWKTMLCACVGSAYTNFRLTHGRWHGPQGWHAGSWSISHFWNPGDGGLTSLNCWKKKNPKTCQPFWRKILRRGAGQTKMPSNNSYEKYLPANRHFKNLHRKFFRLKERDPRMEHRTSGRNEEHWKR